jgi:hypothetical protein
MIKRKAKIWIVITIIFVALAPVVSLAQTDGGGGFDDPDSGGVPVDGGIIALVVAGAAYGVKRLQSARKNDK